MPAGAGRGGREVGLRVRGVGVADRVAHLHRDEGRERDERHRECRGELGSDRQLACHVRFPSDRASSWRLPPPVSSGSRTAPSAGSISRASCSISVLSVTTTVLFSPETEIRAPTRSSFGSATGSMSTKQRFRGVQREVPEDPADLREAARRRPSAARGGAAVRRRPRRCPDPARPRRCGPAPVPAAGRRPRRRGGPTAASCSTACDFGHAGGLGVAERPFHRFDLARGSQRLRRPDRPANRPPARSASADSAASRRARRGVEAFLRAPPRRSAAVVVAAETAQPVELESARSNGALGGPQLELVRRLVERVATTDAFAFDPFELGLRAGRTRPAPCASRVRRRSWSRR